MRAAASGFSVERCLDEDVYEPKAQEASGHDGIEGGCSWQCQEASQDCLKDAASHTCVICGGQVRGSEESLIGFLQA